jgi:hypothetical protein
MCEPKKTSREAMLKRARDPDVIAFLTSLRRTTEGDR